MNKVIIAEIITICMLASSLLNSGENTIRKTILRYKYQLRCITICRGSLLERKRNCNKDRGSECVL